MSREVAGESIGLAVGDHIGVYCIPGSHALSGDLVEVPEASETIHAHLLGDSQAVEQCFILGDVVGAASEVEL